MNIFEKKDKNKRQSFASTINKIVSGGMKKILERKISKTRMEVEKYSINRPKNFKIVPLIVTMLAGQGVRTF